MDIQDFADDHPDICGYMWISLTENADWSKPGYPEPHSWTNDFYGRWIVHDSLFTSLKPAPGAPKKLGETRRN